MANQKQRRRRAKEKRHDYDLVEIDAAGNETVVTAADLKVAQPKDAKPVARAKTAKSGSAGRERMVRAVPPPSWRRVFRRAAIVGPAFLLVLYLLGGKNVTAATMVLNAAFLLIMFVPFSYFLDGFMYRQYLKRNPEAARAAEVAAKGTSR